MASLISGLRCRRKRKGIHVNFNDRTNRECFGQRKEQSAEAQREDAASGSTKPRTGGEGCAER
jgi:hypothetical protein